MKKAFAKLSGSEKQALEILREIAQHLSYDAGLNDSAFTANPKGNVSLNEGSFWLKNVASLPASANGPLVRLVRETDAAIRSNVTEWEKNGNKGKYGTLALDTQPGSIWQRIQAQFDSPPDVITDVVAPLIRASIKNGPKA